MVLGNKGDDGLEQVRFFEKTDKAFGPVVNRPLRDLAERDADLTRLHDPSRGLHVDQTETPSAEVEVAAGRWVAGASVVTPFAGVTLGPISAPSAGEIRIDLVWLDLSDNTAKITPGTPGDAGDGFAALTKPSIPANTGAVPLAFLYVGEDSGSTVAFARSVDANTAGHIEDARPSNGTGSGFQIEDTVGELRTDAAGGALGSRNLVARSDHRHPLNVSAATPSGIDPGDAGAPGTSGAYSRSDHRHAVPVASAGSTFLPDVLGGAPGTSGQLARADHRHPLNAGSTVPPASAATGLAGSSSVYARDDHRHATGVELAYVTDQKPSGTSGGTANAGVWQVRDLNTVVVSAPWLSVSGNVVTLQAGTYFIQASAPAFGVNSHRTRIVQTSPTAAVFPGVNGYARSGSGRDATHSFACALVSAGAAMTVRLEHRFGTSKSGDGLGRSLSSGDPEVYADFRVLKIG